MGVSVVMGILLYGGSLVLDNDPSLSAAQFLTYIAVFSQILPAAKGFSTAMSTVQRGLVSMERLVAVLDTPAGITDGEQTVAIQELKEGIGFEQVSFAYREAPVLKNISFSIKKGQKVALVGPSGGGKSTLADLLPRFYEVQQGRISIDGNDIRNYPLHSLRSLMGIVTQESVLFNDTVHHNIAFANTSATREEVIRAAKIANAHDFIMQMEQGYDTPVGDRGGRLSGGQRQRISIARAVLQNPPILILDEATSALDTESEKLVQQAIENLMKDRTSLVIAHRLSTIQNADHIVVIQEGAIVEQGKHNELLHLNGLYARLVQMQAF
jgi:subfamily B ATP-binding cassette protein MsbA